MINQTEELNELPIHQAPYHVWDLNETTTSKYSKVLAAPSDYHLKVIWFMWLSITGFVTVFATTVFIAILLNKRIRKNPFNTYLLFLMVPDIFMSGSCVTSCILNLMVGHYYSDWQCYFQSFYLIFGISANSWLNGVIAWQLHNMLRMSYDRRRFRPPSRWTVAKHAGLVYLWAAFVSSWGLNTWDWFPHKTGLVNGMACIPLEFSVSSSYFFYFAFVPSLVLIPLMYVIYVCIDIMRHNLLPPTGKRRLLAVYFFRLCAVFIIMWIPSLVFIWIVGGFLNHWSVFAGGSWSHFQGAVSAAVSLMKPDIYKATLDLLCCRVTRETIFQEPKEEKRHPSKPRCRRASIRGSTLYWGSGVVTGVTDVSVMGQNNTVVNNIQMALNEIKDDDDNDDDENMASPPPSHRSSWSWGFPSSTNKNSSNNVVNSSELFTNSGKTPQKTGTTETKEDREDSDETFNNEIEVEYEKNRFKRRVCFNISARHFETDDEDMPTRAQLHQKRRPSIEDIPDNPVPSTESIEAYLEDDDEIIEVVNTKIYSFSGYSSDAEYSRDEQRGDFAAIDCV